MTETCKSIYQISRINADMGQKDAAPCLGVDECTLSRHENKGDGEAPDDVVDRMMTLYRDQFMGYQHAMHNPVARHFLPAIERRRLSSAACHLYSAFTRFAIVQSDMIEIAKDDKFDRDERERMGTVNDAVDEIIKAAFEWKFAVPDGKDR